MGTDLIQQKLLFSKEECSYLKSLFKEEWFERSRVTEKNKYGQYSKARTSYDIYLSFDIDKKNILTNKLKNLGVVQKPDVFSVLRYDVGQEFKKHRDNIGPESKRYEKRYKTVIIQLSDIDDYKGGDLVIYDNNDKTVASKEIGNSIIFNSSLEHELKKLIEGRRYCLVFWLEKSHFNLQHDLI